jgi:hypothetical protein
MPTWGELLNELTKRVASDPNGLLPLDALRRESMSNLAKISGRPTVVYATRWTLSDVRTELVQMNIEDVHGFMEVLHGIQGPKLDLIVHSSGGSPTAAEAIINYIRTRFDDVRVIVPHAAMSAATLLACAADVIVMGKHSFLGPIDPQLMVQTASGLQMVPAQMIKAQFAMAQQAAGTPQFTAWIPMLQQYGPALLAVCDQASALSEDLAKMWLEKWMFRKAADPTGMATTAAKFLNDHTTHRTHGRFLSRDAVRSVGIHVEDLEKDQAFQDAVLTVYHAFSLTFAIAIPVNKIIENHISKAHIRMAGTQLPLRGKVPDGPPLPAAEQTKLLKSVVRLVRKQLGKLIAGDN